jgi:hypothetical protein
MADTTETGMRDATVGGRTLYVRGALAVVVSVLANVILLTAVLRSEAVAPMEPLNYPPVILFTGLGSLAGVLVFAALRARVDRPAPLFRRIALGALVLSLVPDLGLLAVDPAATVPGVVVLMAMHVVAAAVTVEAVVGIRRS